MKIAVVDDDKRFAAEAEACIRESWREAELFFRDGCTLLNDLETGRNFDVYLFDVEMPGLDGMELAERVRALEPDACIIFLTSHERYAVRGFKLGVYYYILKAEYRTELPLILERLRRQEEESREECYIIQTELRRDKMPVDQILYLKKDQKYTEFHCKDGRTYRERSPLGKVWERLPRERFLYIDRGIIVNMKHIIGVAQMEITLCDGTRLQMSRRMSREVKDKLVDYWG